MYVLEFGQRKAFIPNHLAKGGDGTCIQPRVAIGRVSKGSIDHVGTAISLNRFDRLVIDQNEDIAMDLMWNRRVSSGTNQERCVSSVARRSRCILMIEVETAEPLNK